MKPGCPYDCHDGQVCECYLGGRCDDGGMMDCPYCWEDETDTDEQDRAFAVSVLVEHTPSNQRNLAGRANPYDRCVLCGYTSHPCDTHDLARMLIAALDRLAKTEADAEDPDGPSVPIPTRVGTSRVSLKP